MATVTLELPFDMRVLPTAVANGGSVITPQQAVVAFDPDSNSDNDYTVLFYGDNLTNPPALITALQISAAESVAGVNGTKIYFFPLVIQGLQLDSSEILALKVSGNLQALLASALAGSDSMFGSAGVDYINGYGGNDVIHGAGGADTIDGNQGNDMLLGDTGGDLLGGNIGRDVLIGGPGADRLCPYVFIGVGNDNARDIMRFTSLTDSGVNAATRDQIFGFIKGAGATADRIDLSPIDADPSLPGNQAFHLVAAFTAAHGEVRLVTSGGNTIVQVDGDKDPAIDMTILVHNVVGMHAFDLIL